MSVYSIDSVKSKRIYKITCRIRENTNIVLQLWYKKSLEAYQRQLVLNIPMRIPEVDNPEIESGFVALLRAPFIIALAVLLLNDFMLKQVYPGFVTGKLSDFAGIFVFAVFWSSLLPRGRAIIIGSTAIGFFV
jgi:hypothetical protein